MADFYLFRIPFMISSGVEASWRAIGETPYLKMLFGVDIFGMNIGKGKGLTGYKLQSSLAVFTISFQALSTCSGVTFVWPVTILRV